MSAGRRTNWRAMKFFCSADLPDRTSALPGYSAELRPPAAPTPAARTLQIHPPTNLRCGEICPPPALDPRPSTLLPTLDFPPASPSRLPKDNPHPAICVL